MPDRPVFLDSNILIYAYSATDMAKADIARRLLASGNTIISAQVVNEFVSVTSKKWRLSMDMIEKAVHEFLPFVRTMPLSAETSLLALRLAQRYRLAWYDSLIIAAALENGCSLLLSEDLQHGQIIENSLTIMNPFRVSLEKA